jgi:peptide/nickel transport system ATP-binding protein/peptide/nickel transport system permease protein
MSEVALTMAPRRAQWGTRFAASLRLLFRNRLAGFGLIVLILVCLTALLAPIWPLPDPDATKLAERLVPAGSPGHWLGTDHLGRDLLARMIWGTRVSLMVGIIATTSAALIGSLVGLISGFWGGRLDNWMMRIVDMIMALPYMLLALAIVAALGPGLSNAMIAISVVNIPFFARNVRGQTVGLVRRDFVDAARLGGIGNWSILFSEILPNVMPVIVITMSTTVGWMILETAGLSFLGLGAQPPTADLGSMLGEGRKLLITAPAVSVLPGLVIFIIVMSINLLGDGIRDMLDPRLKSGALSRPAARTKVALANGETTGIGQKTSQETSTAASILDVRDLEVQFNVRDRLYRAVNKIDFFVKPGECLGIVGESGCGKSVTALSLMGLVPTPPGRITSGQVLLEGEDMIRAKLGRLQEIRGNKVAYIFQDPLTTLHPMIPIGEQLAEAVQLHGRLSNGEAWARAVELLDLVRIPNAAERAHGYPHEMSGGMRQRVGIAMALANDPDVIIADEPTTALDVTIQAQVLRLLDQLRRERGLALIFITHDFGVVSQMCDRVMVMYAGRVVETGTTEQVTRTPAHPYTRRLLACVPQLGQPGKGLTAIAGRPPQTDQLPEGCAFAPRCPIARDDCRRGVIAMAEVEAGHTARCLFAPSVFDGEAM